MPSVRHGALLLARHLGERATIGRVEEDRVVAEAAVAGWRLGDAALDHTPGLEADNAVAVRRRQRAHEPGRARRVRLRGQSPGNLGEARGVSGVVTQETRRVHAGRAVERVHGQARVFRHHQGAGVQRRAAAPPHTWWL